MPYETWTNEDIEKYKRYSSKIKDQYLGSLSISGIYQKSDPYTNRTVTASVFRVYDGNNYCPERRSLQTNPNLSIKVEGGKVKGLVVLIEKNSATKSFFDINSNAQTERISAGAAWISAYYTGGAAVVATHIVKTHQGYLHEGCFTLGEKGERGPVLDSAHIRTYILPAATKAFESKIVEADKGITSYKSGLEAEDSQDIIIDEIKNMLGEEFDVDDAKISFVPAEEMQDEDSVSFEQGDNNELEVSNIEEPQTEMQEDLNDYEEIMERLTKKDVFVDSSKPVESGIVNEQ